MEKELGRLQVRKRWVVKVVGCLGGVLVDTLKRERERGGWGGRDERNREKDKDRDKERKKLRQRERGV